jgi:tetratricopeptide (TPR) repeat protein
VIASRTDPARASLEDARPAALRQLLSEADRARHLRQDRRAIALYRQLLLEAPRNVEVALRAAPLLASAGESFEAWQLFRMAATELYRLRRYDACLAALRDACRSVPHEFDAWRLRAELEHKLGREDAAYDTLLEGAQRFRRAHDGSQAIALLTRARAIDPWDPEAALDLARLYARAGMSDSALALLASIAPDVGGRTLRRVRGLQWRITLSLYHAGRWIQALLQELRGERAPTGFALGPGPRPGRERQPAEIEESCLALDPEVPD